MRLPGICVVVPVTGFSEYLDQLALCFESIRLQTLLASEVDIVVSYMPQSDVDIPKYAVEMMHHYRATIVLGRPSETYLPALIRNIGGRWSRRQFVTFVDADAVLNPVALEASVGEGGPGIVTTISTMMSAPGPGADEYYNALKDASQFMHLVRYSSKAPGTGCCTVTTTDDFERARGFHEGLRGYGPTDWEFTERLVNNGFQRKRLSVDLGLFNLHQNHPRPIQDADVELTPCRKENRAVFEKSLKAKGLTRNGKRWGGC